MRLGCIPVLLCAFACGCGGQKESGTTGDAPDVPSCDPWNQRIASKPSGLRSIELPAPNDAGELDLSGWDLSCADLSFLDLRGANLSGADLHGSALLATRLAEANLSGADLTEAALNGTDFTGADLTGADLSGTAPPEDAVFPGSPILVNATLEGALVVGAGLRGSDLSGANFVGADLSDTVVDDADFTWTKAFDLVGCPRPFVRSLPYRGAAVTCVPAGESFAIVGTRVDLVGADLAGVSVESIVGARAYDLRECPELVDGAAYSCVEQPATEGWAVVGPQMSVLDADFTGIDLTDVKTIGETDYGPEGLLDCPALLSEGTRCAKLPDTTSTHLLFGPGVDLSGVALQEFDFLGADLSGADLTNANLLFSDLTDVRLGGATLAGATAFNLQACPAELPADFRCVEGTAQADGGPFAVVGPGVALGSCPGAGYEADLSGADLGGVNLAGATLDFVNLSGADLSGADLSGTVLAGADLSNADLTGADLSDAKLGPLMIEGELCSATPWGADLTGAVLTDVVWSNTSCPDGTNSDDHGATCEGFLEVAP